MLRVNNAFNELKRGRSVTTAAFNSDYASLSGFNESFQNIFGSSGGNINNKTVINIVRFATKLGPMYACATDQGLCLLEFTDRRMLETEFEDLCKRLNAVILPGKNVFLNQAQTEVSEYMDGKRKDFTVPLVIPGSEFQQLVWEMLKTIPYGETMSYQQQAMMLGKLSSVRAIARAKGCNRISIVIPCHRVVGINGDLKGYGGGVERNG
jgi:AraC family transcriptional regulator of adaptative response/methylated-DNA-[protein]-cysteine methyltransferase